MKYSNIPDKYIETELKGYTEEQLVSLDESLEVAHTLMEESRREFLKSAAKVDGKLAFNMFQSHGIPIEVTTKYMEEANIPQLRNSQFEDGFTKEVIKEFNRLKYSTGC